MRGGGGTTYQEKLRPDRIQHTSQDPTPTAFFQRQFTTVFFVVNRTNGNQCVGSSAMVHDVHTQRVEFQRRTILDQLCIRSDPRRWRLVFALFGEWYTFTTTGHDRA